MWVVGGSGCSRWVGGLGVAGGCGEWVRQVDEVNGCGRFMG